MYAHSRAASLSGAEIASREHSISSPHLSPVSRAARAPAFDEPHSSVFEVMQWQPVKSNGLQLKFLRPNAIENVVAEPFRDIHGNWNPFRQVVFSPIEDKLFTLADRPVPTVDARGADIPDPPTSAEPVLVWHQGPQPMRTSPRQEISSPVSMRDCVLPHTPQQQSGDMADFANEPAVTIPKRHARGFRLTDVQSMNRYCFTSPLTLVFRGPSANAKKQKARNFFETSSASNGLPIAYEFVLWGPVGIVIQLRYGRIMYLVCRSVEEADQFQRTLIASTEQRQQQRSSSVGSSPRSPARDDGGTDTTNTVDAEPPNGGKVHMRPFGEPVSFRCAYVVPSRALRENARHSLSGMDPLPPSIVHIYRSRVAWWQRLKYRLGQAHKHLTLDLRRAYAQECSSTGLGFRLVAVVSSDEIREEDCESLATCNLGHENSFGAAAVGEVELSIDLVASNVGEKRAWLAWMWQHGASRIIPKKNYARIASPGPSIVTTPVKVQQQQAKKQEKSPEPAEPHTSTCSSHHDLVAPDSPTDLSGTSHPRMNISGTYLELDETVSPNRVRLRIRPGTVTRLVPVGGSTGAPSTMPSMDRLEDLSKVRGKIAFLEDTTSSASSSRSIRVDVNEESTHDHNDEGSSEMKKDFIVHAVGTSESSSPSPVLPLKDESLEERGFSDTRYAGTINADVSRVAEQFAAATGAGTRPNTICRVRFACDVSSDGGGGSDGVTADDAEGAPQTQQEPVVVEAPAQEKVPAELSTLDDQDRENQDVHVPPTPPMLLAHPLQPVPLDSSATLSEFMKDSDELSQQQLVAQLFPIAVGTPMTPTSMPPRPSSGESNSLLFKRKSSLVVDLDPVSLSDCVDGSFTFSTTVMA